MKSGAASKSSLMVIFTTVLVDLIGFGIVIPLVGLYGRHYGANGWQLSFLGAIFSLLQFVFMPFWGSLSDRVGRRPVILVSLFGSTVSYLIFAFAPDLTWLLISRAFGGIFAANISAAQAYIADITTPENRAKGMGLIGASFGIGFTLGPPLGGIAAAKLGLAAPGLIAAAICGLNGILAAFRLPESLSEENRKKAERRSLAPIQIARLKALRGHKELLYLIMASFFVTFAFSNMEQTLSLLFQTRFGFETGEAGYKVGIVLMAAGVLGAYVQGSLIRKLVARWGEKVVMCWGLGFNFVAMAIFPYAPTYASYFLITIPMTLGSALVNPTLAALTSKEASASEQGSIMGLSQGTSALARAIGPFVGLMAFSYRIDLPYLIAAMISILLLGFFYSHWRHRYSER